MTYNTHPFQLLEINVISAQDLVPVSKSMKTYAVVWVHPERKLSPKVDHGGNINPQWNEKFVFRVDETFLNADTSSVMIEIYAASCSATFRSAPSAYSSATSSTLATITTTTTTTPRCVDRVWGFGWKFGWLIGHPLLSWRWRRKNLGVLDNHHKSSVVGVN
ncbi:unnamed protein product [Linum trigynum]|uniref:C2 domain-containing protein n=1 Tax=Linum trigynum TaxID=586398 RepID=A0AAV2DCX9_9ROSI